MQGLLILSLDDGRDGFRLAGADQLVVEPGELEAVLPPLLAKKETGLIIVDERLLTGDIETWFNGLTLSWPGLLMRLPAPGDTAPEEDELKQLIRRALGYHVRLQS
jgi:vacuolar-type H+-ATPase subunit F/Vma7